MPRKYTQEEFEEKVKKIHGDKIDLSRFIYRNSSTKGLCRCNICGNEWYVRPYSLIAGHGCRRCYDKKNREQRTMPIEEINRRIHEKNNTVTIIGEYVDTKTKCLVRCDRCQNEWRTLPSDLCRGHGCPECNNSWSERRKTAKQFIEEMNVLYNGEYVYLLDSNIVRNRDKIRYICPKHGEIEQLVATHMKGNGCPHCMESGLEKHIRIAFERNNVTYIQWYRDKWLGRQSLDFYIPDKNIAIEVQGQQHFVPREMFGGEEGLRLCRERDLRKQKICEENGIKLIYFLERKYVSHMGTNDIYFTDEMDLIDYLKRI